jgi:hypothetical protein
MKKAQRIIKRSDKRFQLFSTICTLVLFINPPAQGSEIIAINNVTDLSHIGLSDDLPLNGNYKLVLQNFGSGSYSEYDSLDLGPILNPSTDGDTRYVAAYIGGPVYVNGTFLGQTNVFTGTFDGNGKTLTGLNRPLFWSIEGSSDSRSVVENLTLETQETFTHPTDPSLNEQGLQSTYGELPQFPRGVLANDVKYLDVRNVDVSGSINANTNWPLPGLVEKIGGLTGSADHSSFTNVTSDVDITVRTTSTINGFAFNNAANKVGGLIGDASFVNIQDSSSQGDVKGTRYVGGLVGNLANSTLTNVTASGNISAQSEVRDVLPDLAVGGLIGRADNSQIADALSSGDVYGNEGIGGFIGMSANNSISDSRATGRVVVGESLVGGFIGISSNDSIVRSSSSSRVSGGLDSGGFVGRFSLGQIRDSYIISEMATGLFGKIIESDVENSYSFTLGNPETWNTFLKFADQIISENLINQLSITELENASIATTIGQPIKLFVDFSTQTKLRIWIQTPSGDRVILGDLEIIDGKLTLPTMEFSEVGNYKLELTEVESDQAIEGESVLTIAITVGEKEDTL